MNVYLKPAISKMNPSNPLKEEDTETNFEQHALLPTRTEKNINLCSVLRATFIPF